MRQLVILDDSVTYFTHPAHLQQVYGRLWDAGIPIAVAVTPAQLGMIDLAQPAQRILAAIPPQARGQRRSYKLADNAALCRYLNVLTQQRLVEIVLRGYHGTWDEFASDDDILLNQKIEEGIAEIQQAIPDAKITTVVLPEQHASTTALTLLGSYGVNAVTYAPQMCAKRVLLNQHCQRFHYGDPLFSPHGQPATQLDRAIEQLAQYEFLLLRQVYWAFFYDWQDQPNPAKFAWDTFIDELLLIPDLDIETFAYLTRDDEA